MTDSLSDTVRRATYRLLRPLVRVLLRHGVAYGSFAELVRKAYTDEGFAHLRVAGHRASISSVAALTGLTRKEVKRLHEMYPEDSGGRDERYNRAIRIVSAWLADPRFTGANGRPAVLPLDGEGSFSLLVKDYSGDIPPGAMLSILETSGTVARVEAGVELLQRAYLPSHTPEERIDILGRDVAELITSIGHNLSASREIRVFQRKVSNPAIREDALAAFRELSNRKSQELLEEYHRWLSGHEIDPDSGEQQHPHYVAVGIYYCDDTLDEDFKP